MDRADCDLFYAGSGARCVPAGSCAWISDLHAPDKHLVVASNRCLCYIASQLAVCGAQAKPDLLTNQLIEKEFYASF